MTVLTLDVNSEAACDLMHEHLDTILALLEQPLSRSDVIGRVGSEAILNRMLRHGLLTDEGGTLRAVADVYHQLRQEGMVNFLEHSVLPSLTAGIDGNGFANIATRILKLNTNSARNLRHNRIQTLFDHLTTVSEQPASGVLARMTVMVIGTSNVLSESLGDGDQALHHLKEAAMQRATHSERDLAVLSQYVFLADNKRYTAALKAADEFLAQFEDERVSSIEGTYHLTVASHWQSTTPTVSKGRKQ